MTRTILVPSDFSPNALTAARYAVAIARKSACNIHILHAYISFRSAFQSELANQTDGQRSAISAQKGMTDFLAQLGDAVPGITHSIYKGSLRDAIQEKADQGEISLIVMGTNGASGLKYGLLGSQTFDIATHIKRPLLIVPPEASGYDIRRIAFFTDYQPKDKETMATINALFDTGTGSVTLVHIHERQSPPETIDQEKLEAWCRQIADHAGVSGLKTQLVHGEESVEVVNSVIERLRADLTVLTLVERGFFEKLVNKSLAKAIIHHSKTPVLIAHHT